MRSFLTPTRALFAISIAVSVLVACGGDDTVGPNPTDAGTSDATIDTGTSSSSSGSSGDSATIQDTAPPTDANPPPPDPMIQCGATATCDAVTQDCCLDAPSVCMTKGTCKGSYLGCSDTTSCASGVCCASVTRADGGGDDAGDGGFAGTITSMCATSCAKNELQLCTNDNECTAPELCRRGPGGVKGCRKPAADGGADDAGDASDGD